MTKKILAEISNYKDFIFEHVSKPIMAAFSKLKVVPLGLEPRTR